jgi:hypothetical protein
VLEALVLLEKALVECLAAPTFTVPGAELTGCLDRVHTLTNRLAALQLALVREADARGLAAEAGATSTSTWLADRWRQHHGTVARLVKLAGTVRDGTRAALASATVNVEQAAVISAAVGGLPTEHRGEAERFLLEQAHLFGPRQLSRLGERLLHVVAPEVADRRDAEALERAERRAFQDRALSVLDVPGSSGVRLSGWLDREGAAVVRAALDPLCAPCPDPAGGLDSRSPGQRRADALVDVCRIGLACGELPDNGGDRPQIVVTIPLAALRAGSDQTEPGRMRLGQMGSGCAGRGQTEPGQTEPGQTRPARTALGQTGSGWTGPDQAWLDAGPPDGGPVDGEPAGRDLAVARNLLGDNRSGAYQPALLPVGVLDDGGQLTVATVRRLACDAGIVPAVLGGAGQVLDLGRQRRLFTGPLRRALVLRDGGCAFPACDRPARWCDGHHIRHWADGGSTDLANAVLLCGFHHRLIHRGEWSVRINPADGLPDFVPPATLDAGQRLRRNTFHRRE